MDVGAVNELTKFLVSLGVGGAIAALVLSFYRKDIKQFAELFRITTEQLITVIKENTASNTKLIALIESQERNALRKTDIETMIDIGLKNRLVELSWPKVERDLSGKVVDEK